MTKKQRQASRVPPATSSTSRPVLDVTRRGIRNAVRLRLYVEAGGRCEFDGCNEYLLEHRVTRRSGNFGEAAHIVAFKLEGPRGRDRRPRGINDAANLMLLCPTCHKLIDDHPGDYSREALQEYKRIHEQRVKHLTSLGPAQRTAVLVVKALINGDPVSVPFDHVVEATAPRYPARRDSEVIDLTTITDGGPGFTTAACETIRDRVNHYFGPSGEGNRIGHASIFALAPISLLIFLGRQLTNKVPTNLFQRHRDTERWTWKRGGKAARYSVKRLRRGSGRSKVALVVALSGSIQIRDLPQAIRRSATIYSISLEGQAPRPTFLRTREDLESFRAAYQEALGRIGQNHGLLQSIDIFPAVPAPVAILCGRELLPKVHPSLRVWDYDKTKDGFEFILEV